MNAQLQNIAALSQLMPQQDPMQSLSGLLQLLGGVDELNFRQQDQQMEMEEAQRRQGLDALNMLLAQNQDTRADETLGLERDRFAEDKRRGSLMEAKNAADIKYQNSARQQGQQEIDLRKRQLDLAEQNQPADDYMGLMQIIGNTNLAIEQPQLMKGLLALVLQRRGIELSPQVDPNAAKRAAIQDAAGTNQMWNSYPNQ
jgi:hypothetical protein